MLRKIRNKLLKNKGLDKVACSVEYGENPEICQMIDNMPTFKEGLYTLGYYLTSRDKDFSLAWKKYMEEEESFYNEFQRQIYLPPLDGKSSKEDILKIWAQLIEKFGYGILAEQNRNPKNKKNNFIRKKVVLDLMDDSPFFFDNVKDIEKEIDAINRNFRAIGKEHILGGIFLGNGRYLLFLCNEKDYERYFGWCVALGINAISIEYSWEDAHEVILKLDPKEEAQTVYGEIISGVMSVFSISDSRQDHPSMDDFRLAWIYENDAGKGEVLFESEYFISRKVLEDYSIDAQFNAGVKKMLVRALSKDEMLQIKEEIESRGGIFKSIGYVKFLERNKEKNDRNN